MKEAVPARNRDLRGAACLALLAAGTLAVYSGTFSVPLLFDDHASIADNPSIRHLWPLSSVFSPPSGAGVGGRPFLNLTYSLNFALGGTAVGGYHVANLAIHVFAAWTLFGLVRRTLRSGPMAARFGAHSDLLALGVSAVWGWHPLLTESVTYLSQRAESLMGLFYLLTIYGFARGAGVGDPGAKGPSGRSWVGYGFSWIACLLGMATKEVMITAPLLVVLYDRTFVAGSFSEGWRRHGRVYVALASTWIALGVFLIGIRQRAGGLGVGITGGDYFLAECHAVVTYLRLSLWPGKLVFDYGPGVVAGRLSAVWPEVGVVAALASLAVLAVIRKPVLGFAACAFFVILAPTSSIVPIVAQPIAENRMYLPLAALVGCAILGLYALAGRRSFGAIALVAALLGWTAFKRNEDYASDERIWADTVAKAPSNARAHNSLGDALFAVADRRADARAEYEEAIRLQPSYAEAHANLGDAWMAEPGRLSDAVAQFEEALRLSPNYAAAHTDLGGVWMNVPGRLNDAAVQFEEALRLEPDNAAAHENMGNVWARMPGRSNDAIAEYREALRLDPMRAPAHFGLGNVFARLPGREREAVAEYREALRWNPGYAEAHNNLGNALAAGAGSMADAIPEFAEAVRLKPDFAEAHNNLGNALAGLPGRMNEAIAHYQEAVRLDPSYAEARNNLGCAWLAGPGHEDEAIAQFEAALRMRPDYAKAHLNLAIALLRIGGRESEARMHLESVLRLDPANSLAREILASLRQE